MRPSCIKARFKGQTSPSEKHASEALACRHAILDHICGCHTCLFVFEVTNPCRKGMS